VVVENGVGGTKLERRCKHEHIRSRGKALDWGRNANPENL